MGTYGSALCLGGALLVAATAWGSPEVDEVEQCVRGNLPQTSSVQTVTMVATDRTGGQRSLAGKLYWKRGDQDRSKVLLKLDAPPDMRGSAYLMLEREEEGVDVFVYLPELKRVRRVAARAMEGSLFGTDFSYEDFRRLQRIVDQATTARLPDGELDGRPVYQVRTTPPEDESGYQRVDAFVDRETCVPLKLELYQRDEEPRKVVSVAPADLSREGSIWVPRKLTIRDVKDGTETRMEVEEIEVDAEVPDRVFTQAALTRGH